MHVWDAQSSFKSVSTTQIVRIHASSRAAHNTAWHWNAIIACTHRLAHMLTAAAWSTFSLANKQTHTQWMASAYDLWVVPAFRLCVLWLNAFSCFIRISNSTPLPAKRFGRRTLAIVQFDRFDLGGAVLPKITSHLRSSCTFACIRTHSMCVLYATHWSMRVKGTQREHQVDTVYMGLLSSDYYWRKSVLMMSFCARASNQRWNVDCDTNMEQFREIELISKGIPSNSFHFKVI